MTAQEAAIFESSPLFTTCLRMREFDEAAKDTSKVTPDFNSFSDLIASAIRNPQRTAELCPPSFCRNGNTLIALDASLLSI
jgi:hypothetical protein